MTFGFCIKQYKRKEGQVDSYYYYNPILESFIKQMPNPSDTQYHQSAAITIIVLNAISFLSLCFVLFIYIYKWKKIASFPMRLSFYLCIACTIQNLYVLMLNPILVQSLETQGSTTSGFCMFESVLKVAFDLSSIIWTTLIIYSCYASIVLKKSLDSSELSYLIIAYVVPLLLAIIPVFFSVYGYNTYFCWFSATNLYTQFALKMGYFYLPLWILFFFNIFFVTKTYAELKSLGLQRRELTIFKRLMLFPLILLITGFLSTVDQIYNFLTSKNPVWLDIFSIILLSLYGFFNSIAYGFNPIVRQQIQIVLGIKKQSELIQLTETSRSSRGTQKLQELIN